MEEFNSFLCKNKRWGTGVVFLRSPPPSRQYYNYRFHSVCLRYAGFTFCQFHPGWFLLFFYRFRSVPILPSPSTPANTSFLILFFFGIKTTEISFSFSSRLFFSNKGIQFPFEEITFLPSFSCPPIRNKIRNIIYYKRIFSRFSRESICQKKRKRKKE